MELTQAQRLHRKQPVLIAHADLPGEILLRRRAGERNILSKLYGPRFLTAGVRAVVAAVFVHPVVLPQMALSDAMAQIGTLLDELETCGGLFRLVRTRRELDAALEQGQIAVLLSLEGSEPLEGDLTLLRTFYELGVRAMGLTWNNRTMAADGCGLPGAGLTAFGRALAERAQTLGVLLDASHLNDEGLRDLLSCTHGPIIASHSNCRALCAHPRNLTDAQLAQLAARGGVIGLNQIRFLSEGPAAGTGNKALLAHLMHLIKVAGPAHVGLGLDMARGYMGALAKPKAFWARYDPAEEDILRDYDALLPLTEALLQSGVSEPDATAVLGGNFLRVFRESLP